QQATASSWQADRLYLAHVRALHSDVHMGRNPSALHAHLCAFERARNGQNLMDRHERRAAKVATRSAKIDLVVAVHEAGHAVARFLTAGDLGFSADDAISYIEMAPDSAVTKSIDKRM